ncbi:mitochondrial 54S ribosomal protein mrpl1 [Tulasnella sp. 418]|nr:mitochondrial 54S ribosomal protein mrpl1 [Tulasnella sp. 418]
MAHYINRLPSIRPVSFIRTFSSSSVQCAPRKSVQEANRTARRQKLRAKSREEAGESMKLQDAAQILRAVEVANSSSAYEVAIVTKFVKGSAPPRGRVALPRDARAKAEVILVFAEGNTAADAVASGADFVGGAELIPEVLSSSIQPTKVLCTPALLPVITPKLARFLGPKGLMPSVKRSTVVDNVAPAIRAAKGTMDWKGDKLGVIRAPVARINWPLDDVVKNVKAFLAAVKEGTTPTADGPLLKKRPSTILSVYLSSTRGPGIQVVDAV